MFHALEGNCHHQSSHCLLIITYKIVTYTVKVVLKGKHIAISMAISHMHYK